MKQRLGATWHPQPARELEYDSLEETTEFVCADTEPRLQRGIGVMAAGLESPDENLQSTTNIESNRLESTTMLPSAMKASRRGSALRATAPLEGTRISLASALR